MPFTIGGEWVPEKSNTPKKPVKIRKERRGNTLVTIISHLPLEADGLKALCSKLKQKLGCGGSVKSDCIELQGDKIEQVKPLLNQEGIKVSL